MFVTIHRRCISFCLCPTTIAVFVVASLQWNSMPTNLARIFCPSKVHPIRNSSDRHSKNRKEAKSWYSARKQNIKASFVMQYSSDNLLYFRPGDPQGEFDMLLPGAVPLNVDRTKLLMTSRITKISCGRISNPAHPISF